MIGQFNMPNLELLQAIGYEVHIACNFESGNTCDKQSINTLKEKLKAMGILCFQIDFARNVYNLKQNKKAYIQMLTILKNEKYEFLHCHSPIGGVIGRIAAVKTKIKVVYTAHGFHFYKGAPLKNWVCYYPVEHFLAKYTDILITINQEDYHMAQKLGAKKVEYIPGIGIDLKHFFEDEKLIAKEKKRKELGVSDDTVMILSVGELNKNKNHEVVIDALSQSESRNFQYIICGQGKLENRLSQVIRKFHLEKKIKLLGFRTDINELYLAADLFVFPSLREGLSVALMEAMAAGLPIICGDIRGNIDLVNNNGGALIKNIKSKEKWKEKIEQLMNSEEVRKNMGKYNEKKSDSLRWN